MNHALLWHITFLYVTGSHIKVVTHVTLFNCDKNALLNFRDASYVLHVGKKSQSGYASEHTRREAAKRRSGLVMSRISTVSKKFYISIPTEPS